MTPADPRAASQERPQPESEIRDALRRLIGPVEPDGIGDEEQHWANHPEWPDDEAMLLGTTVGELRRLSALLSQEQPQPVHQIGPGYCKTCDPGFGHNHPDWQERPSIDVERLAEAILRHDADDSWTMGEQLAHDRGHCGNRKCATVIEAIYSRLSGPVGE